MLGRSVAFGVKCAEKHLIRQNFFELTTPIVHPSPELSRASSKCSLPKMYLSSAPPVPPTRNAKINQNKVLTQTQTKTLQTQPLIFSKLCFFSKIAKTWTWTSRNPGNPGISLLDSALDNFPFLVGPNVVKVFSEAKLVDIFWIKRYQMKDTDILCP